jgi:ADP-heptose:LPS heptosyltransferase
MRSINHLFATEIAKTLSKDYIVINMNGANGFSHFPGVINFAQDPDLRTWAAIIQEADYFIGCDSCGQHIAKAVDTPASVYVGGTHEVNISYPDTFHIIKNGATYYPNPMRVSMMNSTLADKLNQKRGSFTDEEMKSNIKEIVRRIEGGKKVTDAVTVKVKKEKSDKGF